MDKISIKMKRCGYQRTNTDALNNFMNKLNKTYEVKVSQATIYTTYLGCYYDNALKIFNLCEIFGTNAPLYLQSILVNTPLAIERFFSNYLILDKEIANKILSEFTKINAIPSKNQVGILAGFIAMIQELPDDHQSEFFKTLDGLVSSDKKKTAQFLIDSIYKSCADVYLKSIGINPDEIEREKLKTKLPNERIRQLSKGMTSLSAAQRKVLIAMLKADLSPDDNAFKKFVNNAEGNTELGASIARHNINCKNELALNNIDTDKAFNYTKTEELTYQKSSSKTSDQYIILQWDKNNINTLFLGNDLNCCLATDGKQFPAIIERRLDEACFMHVVINKKTNEPVCLNWLFFDKSMDNEIYIKANFFEIRNNISRDPQLRDLLVKSLAGFTTEYAQDIGAKEFLIRPLADSHGHHYGNIPDFNAPDNPELNFNMVERPGKKVGGYYDMESMKTVENCVYYLLGSGMTKFYQHPKVLPKQEISITKTDSVLFKREKVETKKISENRNHTKSSKSKSS